MPIEDLLSGRLSGRPLALAARALRQPHIAALGADILRKDLGIAELGSLIEGWKKGLLMLKTGGSIKLYIPPSLGYGYSDVTDPQTQAVIIPAGSMLIFDVTLSDLG